MARRPVEAQLYRDLVDSCFQFIERGIRSIDEIYDAVKRGYNNLCEDEYLCPHRRRYGLQRPEWNHVVRQSFDRSSKICDNITHSGRRGYWIFS